MRWSSRYALSASTWTAGASRRIAAVALMPSHPGISRSIRTRSGRSSCASSTAWSPSAASPTTSRSSVRPRKPCSPRRTTAWSSAMRTRMFIGPAPSGWRYGLGSLSNAEIRQYLPATLLAVEAATTHNYVLHELWTFRSMRLSLRRFAHFNLVTFGALLLNVGAVALFVWFGVFYLVANLIGIASGFAVNLVVSSL